MCAFLLDLFFARLKSAETGSHRVQSLVLILGGMPIMLQVGSKIVWTLITFRVRRSRGKVYISHVCVCLYVCLSCPWSQGHTTARTRMQVGGMVGGAL